MAVMTYREALNEALREEMERDDKVILLNGAGQTELRVTDRTDVEALVVDRCALGNSDGPLTCSGGQYLFVGAHLDEDELVESGG